MVTLGRAAPALSQWIQALKDLRRATITGAVLLAFFGRVDREVGAAIAAFVTSEHDASNEKGHPKAAPLSLIGWPSSTPCAARPLGHPTRQQWMG